MSLRPAMAKWFELLVARDEISAALESLAGTGAVELQAHSDTSAAVLLPALRAAVDEYKRLWRRYGEYWPAARREPGEGGREPEEMAAASLGRLRSWAVDADPPIDRLQKLARESSDLQLLERLLSQSSGELPDLQLFAKAGPVLASRACLFPSAPRALGVPPAVLALTIASGEESYLLAVGPAEQLAAFDDTLGVHNARRFALPPGLPAARDAALADVRTRLAAVARESQALEVKVAELDRAHGVSTALADLDFIDWLVQNVPPLAHTEHFAWVTGWTSDLSDGRLRAALDREHLHYLLRFPVAPQGVVQPVVLHNPRWAQPFELFSRLLGMPGASEADPSRLLAFVAPVMFGFMFADVGQGIVLIIVGIALRKRFPATALLIPGGIAAAVFGLLFGSVFGNDSILPAIWLRPLARPLVMLEASLVLGACVILLGLALDAVQHHWSGTGAEWWASSAGLVLSYVAMICAPFDGRALWGLAAGLGWYLAGSLMLAPSDRLSRLGAAAGEALEALLQLAINTVSFVRIGAFALAHAGLGSAVVALAAIFGTAVGARPAAWIMLIIGNVLIIAIEGLVVGIQTTRLVLFEFFIRFLHGSGRPFRPLPLPTAFDSHSSSRTSP
jgi:V/A-type H+-transporting ATPase subunit I